MNEIIRTIKNAGLLGLVISALLLAGSLLDNLIPWEWLTDFFTFFRHIILLIDWTYHTESLIEVMGISAILFGILWGFRATMTAIGWFK